MIRLQIQDKDGKIVQEDELVVEDGDIILCQINKDLSQEISSRISKNLSEGFRYASKRANDGEIVPILYDHTINFKVLKIKREE